MRSFGDLKAVALAVTALALAAPPAVSAETGAVTCTIFVGGRPSSSQTFQLDATGSGRTRLVFEANMYTADVDIEAVNGRVEAGMTMRQEGSQQTGMYNTFSKLRGTVPGPASQSVSVMNGRLDCELK